MIQAIPINQPKALPETTSPALKNPAVARCAALWASAHQTALAKTKNEYRANDAARDAFRKAMPPLSGYDNICDFIACTGYGILIEAIKDDTGSKLLYAAQVALSTIPQQAKTQSRHSPLPAPPFEMTPTPSPTCTPTE